MTPNLKFKIDVYLFVPLKAKNFNIIIPNIWLIMLRNKKTTCTKINKNVNFNVVAYTTEMTYAEHVSQ